MRTPILTAALIVFGGLQAKPLPDVSLFDADATGATFLVKMTNTARTTIDVWPDGACRFRLDGGTREPDWSWTGGTQHVAAGKSWQELVKLVPGPSHHGKRLANPYPERVTVLSYREAHADLTPGDHTVAFSCGGEWSAAVQMHWPPKAQGAVPALSPKP